MDIEIDGIEKLVAKLDKIANTSNIESVVGKACALVEGSAKEKAPKGGGDLRRSITSAVETTMGEVEGTVFTPLFYAPYVEYGTGLFAEEGGRQDVPWHYQDDEGNWHTTSGMHPQPYLRPALHENREKILKIIERGIISD